MFVTAHATGLSVKAKLFRGFGDSSRLSILDALRNDSLTVGEIVEITQLTQSNVSNHLGCLRDCGLVVSEQQGRNVTYRLSDPRVGELMALAESLLAEVARGVYECTRYTSSSSSKRAGQTATARRASIPAHAGREKSYRIL